MFKSYLKIALRSLRKQKIYAFINVVGLAIGVACCALIFLYIRDDLSYDQFHEKADRIYRMQTVRYNEAGGVRGLDVYLPMPLGPTMETDFPEVESYARLYQEDFVLRIGSESTEEEFLIADPSILSIFSFPLLSGDPSTALSDANSVVFTESMARKYFGASNPMGETVLVRINGVFHNLTITAIAEDIPSNSSVHFDFLLPFNKWLDADPSLQTDATNWYSSFLITYVLVRENTSLVDAAEKFLALREQHYPNELGRWQEAMDWESDHPPVSFAAQPLLNVHMNPDVPGGLTPATNPLYAYILGGIAFAVLLIACINFMTLAIGQSTRRAKEIGLRKVVGARRRQLMVQFWGEALALSVMAVGVGLLLAQLLLPIFNNLAQKTLAFDFLAHPEIILMPVTLALVTGLLAGSYPALVLSGFQPINVLKNQIRLGGSNALTKSLVVVQFTLSIGLLVTAVIMSNQLHYMQTQNLGFRGEQLVVIPMQGLDGLSTVTRFRNALRGERDMLYISGTSSSFTRGSNRYGFFYKDEIKQSFYYRVESNYLETMGIELLAGRTFDPNLSTDSTAAIIVNEALVRDFGWTDPLGEQIPGGLGRELNDPVVIGIVSDYNFQSLHNQVMPMMITMDPGRELRFLLVRISPDDVPASLAKLEETWYSIAPDLPYSYSFLDDDMNSQYQAEERWSTIVGYATALSLIVACMGLFGLATLTVAGRIKEVGIRKVLGASAASISLLLSKDFAKLVAIAIVLAAPLAYFAMAEWLQNFAYRIDIGPGVFLLSGGLVLLIAVLTISYQAIKSALANPVDALRYE